MKKTIFILLAAFFIFGCNNSNPQGRIAIYGEVTLDDKPLEQGNIEFTSLSGATPLIATGSPIKNGKFSMRAEFGLIPGQDYCVKFSSMEEVPGTRRNTPENPMNPTGFTFETRDIIPPQYGQASKETVTIEKGKNNLVFNLLSK